MTVQGAPRARFGMFVVEQRSTCHAARYSARIRVYHYTYHAWFIWVSMRPNLGGLEMPNNHSSSSRSGSDSSTRSRNNGHSGRSASSRKSSSRTSSTRSGSGRSGSDSSQGGGTDSILRSASNTIRPVKRAVSSARRSISQRVRNLPAWTPYALGAIGLAALIYGAFQLDTVRDMFTSDMDDSDLFSDYDDDETYSSVASVRSSVGNSF